uniref:Uncharacterized protein n=1 Tax=Anguilla anguilla TaxID=7936 RepID=A0A0E9SV10_ANGAN
MIIHKYPVDEALLSRCWWLDLSSEKILLCQDSNSNAVHQWS